MRGDDTALLFLVVAFLGAALAYAYWGQPDGELEDDEANGETDGGIVDWISDVAQDLPFYGWFESLLPSSVEDKTTGGTTPKEEVDPGDTDK